MIRRRQWRRTGRRTAAIAVALLALGTTACGGSGSSPSEEGGAATTVTTGAAPSNSPGPTDPPATTPTVPATTPATAPAGGASQTPADAERDGVVAAFAALPLGVRMSPVATVAAPEGVWVASRPTPGADGFAEGCRIGPEEGQTPADWICTSEYGEILLLDSTRSRILRAYPLAGVPPEFLRLTDDALYCGRPGDGGLLPDSMVCRIDRTTLAATIRIFPGDPDSVVVQPCFTPPASWAIADRYLPVTGLAADASGVRVEGPAGQWKALDPLTLAVK